MNKKFALSLFAAAFVAMLVFALVQPAGSVSADALTRWGNGNSRGSAAQSRTSLGYNLVPLTEVESEALQSAILEEYGAYNLYQAVLVQYPDATTFATIAVAEQRHANILIRQAEKLGVEVPENPGLAAPVVFATLEDACQAAIAAEIADAALYDELMAVTTHTDLLRVYANLQRASLESHLPAFESCY